ncbi:MAG: type I methionyl aminopeptidase [bacterium]
MIVLKSPQEIGLMWEANQIVAEILNDLKEKAGPGVTTRELDALAEKYIKKRRARSAFKGYRGYPNCLCTSVNEVIVHGVPSSSELREGDILSMDCGVYYKGFYGDAAVTIPIGEIPEETRTLVRTTEECLQRAIDEMKEGNRLSDISFAIQQHAESRGFSVVRDFVGHGIGRQLHEDPQVPNYGVSGTGVRLKTGMVLAIEPMVNQGHWSVRILEDGWTAVTSDGSLSAHFEHSVAITENGPFVLSRLH